jgi:hypothetical protein
VDDNSDVVDEIYKSRRRDLTVDFNYCFCDPGDRSPGNMAHEDIVGDLTLGRLEDRFLHKVACRREEYRHG